MAKQKNSIRVVYLRAPTLASLMAEVNAALAQGAELHGEVKLCPVTTRESNGRAYLPSPRLVEYLQAVVYGRPQQMAAQVAGMLQAVAAAFPGVLPGYQGGRVVPLSRPTDPQFYPYPKGAKLPRFKRPGGTRVNPRHA